MTNDNSSLAQFKSQLSFIYDAFKKLIPEQQSEAICFIQGLYSQSLNYMSSNYGTSCSKDVINGDTQIQNELGNRKLIYPKPQSILSKNDHYNFNPRENCTDFSFDAMDNSCSFFEDSQSLVYCEELKSLSQVEMYEKSNPHCTQMRNAEIESNLESIVQSEFCETEDNAKSSKEIAKCVNNSEEEMQSNRDLMVKNFNSNLSQSKLSKSPFKTVKSKKNSSLKNYKGKKLCEKNRDDESTSFQIKCHSKKETISNGQSKDVMVSKRGRVIRKKVLNDEKDIRTNKLQQSLKIIKRSTSFKPRREGKSRQSLDEDIGLVDHQCLQMTKVVPKVLDATVSCRFCRRSFTSFPDCKSHACSLSVEEKTRSESRLFECMLCKMTFVHSHHLHKHLMGHKRNDCKICNSQFTKKKALCKHMKIVHNITEPEKLYQCHFCEKRFFKRPSLNIHLKKHANGQLVCTKCGTMCENESLYLEHMEQHSLNSKFICKHCDQNFERKQQYEQHMMGHERHVCSMCKVSFPTKKLWHKHQQSVHGVQIVEKKHECLVCNKLFQRPMHLRIHQRIHTGEKPVQCSHCDKSFRNERALGKHMKTARHLKQVGQEQGKQVQLDKPFLCAQCGIRFYRHQSLLRHMAQLHSSTQPFECPYCEYTTKCNTNLKRHLELHSDNKRYVCEICGSSFHALATLNEHHAYVHSEERGFVCELCSKGFKGKSGLKRHMRIHSEARPYKCHCNRSYKRMSHLKRHMVSAHQVIIQTKKVKKLGDSSDTETNLSQKSLLDNSSHIADSLDILRDHSSCNDFPPLLNPNNNFVNQHSEILISENSDYERISLDQVSSPGDDFVYVPSNKLQSFLNRSDMQMVSKMNSTELRISKSSLISLLSAQENINAQETSIGAEPHTSNDNVAIEVNNMDISSSSYHSLNLTASTHNLISMGNVSTDMLSPSSLSVVPSHDDVLVSSAEPSDQIRPHSLPNPNLQNHETIVTSACSFPQFSFHDSDAPSAGLTIPPFLLGTGIHSPHQHETEELVNQMGSCSSKQLFDESTALLGLPPYSANMHLSDSNTQSMPSSNQSRTTTVWVTTEGEHRTANTSDSIVTKVTTLLSGCSTANTLSTSSLSSSAQSTSSVFSGPLLFPGESSISCSLDPDSLHAEELDSLSSQVYDEGVKQFLNMPNI